MDCSCKWVMEFSHIPWRARHVRAPTNASAVFCRGDRVGHPLQDMYDFSFPLLGESSKSLTGRPQWTVHVNGSWNSHICLTGSPRAIPYEPRTTSHEPLNHGMMEEKCKGRCVLWNLSSARSTAGPTLNMSSRSPASSRRSVK